MADKSNLALTANFPAMFLIMLTFLMMQLLSFSKRFMVFMTVPLVGLISVVPALLIFNVPLGVIAPCGLIMRNSVILVDQIQQDLHFGTQPWHGIIDATIRRTRPVVMTAAAAILAITPLTHSVFWGPMAIAIMSGFIVATVLTLGFVPALHAAWFEVRKPISSVENRLIARLFASFPSAEQMTSRYGKMKTTR